MTRVQYFVASTLDGFIADEHDSLDWLMKQPIDEDGPMNYGAFMEGVGALVMGATTYQWVVDHESAQDPDWQWPYEQPCWVFTHRTGLEVRPGADVRFVQGPVADTHAEITAAAGEKNVWVVGGGDLVGQYADLGLLDDVFVSVAPVTLGAGRPLLPRVLDLELTALDRNGAFACLQYRVAGH